MDIEYIAILIPFVVIAAVAKIVLTAMRNHQQIKLAQIEAGSGRKQDAGSDRRQGQRMEMLEDRVEVLERVITDRGYNIAAEIEALRDKAGVPLELGRERVAARNGEKHDG